LIRFQRWGIWTLGNLNGDFRPFNKHWIKSLGWELCV
jgi:hypothetical protein